MSVSLLECAVISRIVLPGDHLMIPNALFDDFYRVLDKDPDAADLAQRVVSCLGFIPHSYRDNDQRLTLLERIDTRGQTHGTRSSTVIETDPPQ